MEIEIIQRPWTEAIPTAHEVPWIDTRRPRDRLVRSAIIGVKSKKHRVNNIIGVPTDYITDWSSTPRIVWPIFPPTRYEARLAATFHDYIYSHLYSFYSKKFADELYKELKIGRAHV